MFNRNWRRYQTAMRDVDRITRQTAQRVSRSGQQMSSGFAQNIEDLLSGSQQIADAMQQFGSIPVAAFNELSAGFAALGDDANVNIARFDQLAQSGMNLTDALNQANEGASGAAQTVSILGRQFSVLSVAIAGTTAALGAAIALTKRSISEYTELAEATRQLHYQTGLLTTEASSWVQVLKASGVSTASSARAMTGFLSKIADMRRETQLGKESTSDFAKALNTLEIDLETGEGTLKSTEQLLGEVNTAFQELGPSYKSAQVATDLFGFSGRFLLPLLVDQSVTLQDLMGIVEDYGASLGALSQKEYAEFRKANFQLQTSIQGVFNFIGQNWIPVLTQVQRIVSDVIGIYRTFTEIAYGTVTPHRTLAEELRRLADALEWVHSVVRRAADGWRRLTDVLNPAAAAARAVAQAEEETAQARAQAAAAAAEAADAEEELRRKREETLEQLGELKSQLA
jgi:hypothetical protein